ncbi:hypothetical protein EPN44_09515 [bacterium]|nr:MAG: hypothetical protein EPN44_09515 [bacterium]
MMDEEFFDEPQPANIRDRQIPGRQSGRAVPKGAAPEDDDLQPADVHHVALPQHERGGRGRGFGGGERRRTGPRFQEAEPRAAAAPSVEPAEAKPAHELLEKLLEKMGVRGEIVYVARPEAEYFEVRGPELANLIGRHGSTLEAVNLVFNNILNLGVKNDRRYYTVDAESYRSRRAEQLKALALRMLERAVRERKPQELDPMMPSERKVIHQALANNTFVTTGSIGEEPERRVVITPVATL